MECTVGEWRSGEGERWAETFGEGMEVEAAALHDAMLIQRNLKGVAQIDSMLQDAGTEFVLVGAADLVGENGLLDLLSQKGYEINQL